MNIKSYKLTATIPTGQYANVQPSIEIEGGSLEEANAVAMGHMKELFARHSEVKLKDNGAPSSVSISIDCSKTVSLESFNEHGVEVQYNDEEHTYSFKGEKLQGATSFIKQYTNEFNAEMVAKNCEKSWGVPADVIASMWKSNADLATQFGTTVHGAIEHYVKYSGVADMVMKSRGTNENPAMPKHPILASIVNGFIEAYTELYGGFSGVESEILVTDIEAMRCG